MIAAAPGRVDAVEHGQDADDADSTMPRPAGVNGTAVSSDAIRATKKAPLMPRWTSKPSARTTN